MTQPDITATPPAEPSGAMGTSRYVPPVNDAALAHWALRADPLADETIAAIAGDWRPMEHGTDGVDLERVNAEPLRRIRMASSLMRSWTTNASLHDWRAVHRNGTPVDPQVAAPLERFAREAQLLPDWADAQLIAEAEGDFFEIGPLSCLLLFCASLPECYVLPDLADVLHATGQLDAHADYRVRSTASMIFPVMMKGGLTSPQGSGIAQVMKVRLIHATVRNLILRQSPQQALARLQQASNDAQHGVITPLHTLKQEANAHGREDAPPERK
jgi:hypothetical protein